MVELRQGDLSLRLAPSTGGSIAAFRSGGRDLMRPAPDGATDPLAMACFPLLPFSNRVAGGRFRFQDRAVHLPPDAGFEPHAIHGVGWQARWDVLEASSHQAQLVWHHPAGAWPWSFEAEQLFMLDGRSLTHRITLTNADDKPMPAGLGAHPYFPKTSDVLFMADVTGVWHTTADGLPAGHGDLPDPWDWRTPERIRTARVDHCFTGWSGEASISWPERGLSLRMTVDETLDHLVVFAPPEADFFCVEPVSHETDAVNGTSGTMRTLAPAERWSATIRYRVEDIV